AGNHWGTYDVAVIDHNIYDDEEDINDQDKNGIKSGEVVFQPFQLRFVELPIDDNIYPLTLAPLRIEMDNKAAQLGKRKIPAERLKLPSKFRPDDKMSQDKAILSADILPNKEALGENEEILRRSLRIKPLSEEGGHGEKAAKSNETHPTGAIIEIAPTIDFPRTIVGKDGAEMALIPPGEFLMGSADTEGNEDEHPQHRIYVGAFYIDRHEVTNAQYRRFIEETGYREPDFWDSSHLNRPCGRCKLA
ncbi:MAG: formylglycine-generating enzyme family protein, partial [Candidatus Poribacteria bacterium]